MPERTSKRKKDLFWVMVSKVLAHCSRREGQTRTVHQEASRKQSEVHTERGQGKTKPQ
jgi:hypothetical protein